VKRREFITLLGGAAAAWPPAVRNAAAGDAGIGLLSGASASFSGPCRIRRGRRR
jgi:hypothetical protein